MTANKQQKKKTPLWLKSIAFIILGAVFVLLFIAYKAFTSDDPNYEISHNGEKMGNFTRYQGNIYASVPSNGNYLIKADASSFQSLNDQTLDRQIGRDKDHVFCISKS